MQHMGYKLNNPVHTGNKISSNYKRHYLQLQPMPISHSQSQSPIERSHIKNH